MFSWKISKTFTKGICIWTATSKFKYIFHSFYSVLQECILQLGTQPILKITVSIVRCDGHISYFAQLIYYIHRSFTKNNLFLIFSNITKEDQNKTLIQFVSVLRHQALLVKLQTIARDKQKLLQNGREKFQYYCETCSMGKQKRLKK